MTPNKIWLEGFTVGANGKIEEVFCHPEPCEDGINGTGVKFIRGDIHDSVVAERDALRTLVAEMKGLAEEAKDVSYWAIQGPNGDGVREYQRSALMDKHSKVIRILRKALAAAEKAGL